jgi:hypothetical protein
VSVLIFDHSRITYENFWCQVIGSAASGIFSF